MLRDRLGLSLSRHSCAESRTRRSAILCSRSRSDERSSTRINRQSARSFRFPMPSRTCSAPGSPGFPGRYAGSCSPLPSAATCARPSLPSSRRRRRWTTPWTPACLVVEDGRIRAAHPLVAAAARKHARLRERRKLHLELAGIVGDGQLRARHLALATSRPDEEVATIVSAAAAAASARAARQEAADLADHALRLTPSTSPERSGRLLARAEYLLHAGERERATEMLGAEVDSLPAGALRARGWLALADGAFTHNDEIVRFLERALEESRDEPGLHASVLARMSGNTVFTRVARLAEAESWALEALEEAETPVPTSGRALYALAWARSLRGQSIDDLSERFAAVSETAYPVGQYPGSRAGQAALLAGELDQAGASWATLFPIADERGEPYSYALLRLHLCQLEQRSGNWDAAEQVLEEWASDREVVAWPMHQRSLAFRRPGAACLRRPSAGRRRLFGAPTRLELDGTGSRRSARGVRGPAHPRSPPGRGQLARGVGARPREGVDEPGAFPVAPDLVEALLELGAAEEAAEVVERLGELARAQEHPWATGDGGTLRRARAGSRVEPTTRRPRPGGGSSERVQRAGPSLRPRAVAARPRPRATAIQEVGRRDERPSKQALAIFEATGAPGWAEQARSELERVGGRRPKSKGALTPAEQRVVELAADGRSNKEIASELFVTVNTVEVHLSHAYAKLGVRSRSPARPRPGRANLSVKSFRVSAISPRPRGA